MPKPRPLATLLLGLATAANSLSCAAAETEMPGRLTHGKAVTAPLIHVAGRDGGDLEDTVDHLVPSSVSPRPTDYLDYVGHLEKIVDAARYPAACSQQMKLMRVLDALALPVTDAGGHVVATFNQATDRLEVNNKPALEAKNACKPGKNETSPNSLLAAEDYVSLVEEAFVATASPSNATGSQIFAPAAWTELLRRAPEMPACNEDLYSALVKVKTLHEQAGMQSPEEVADARRLIVRELAEKPLVEFGECNIRYAAPPAGP